MTDYYVDESGFIVAKVPPEMKRPPTLGWIGHKPQNPAKKCPICGQQVRRLSKHIRKAHADSTALNDNLQTKEEISATVPPDQSYREPDDTVTTKKSIPTVEVSPRVPSKVTALVQCPHCKSPVRSDRLEKHIRTTCPARRMAKSESSKLSASHAKLVAQQESVSNTSPTTGKTGIEEEALRQSLDEQIYGGKYLGHMRREWDGKFGSLPLYDDYEDEADADRGPSQV